MILVIYFILVGQETYKKLYHTLSSNINIISIFRYDNMIESTDY